MEWIRLAKDRIHWHAVVNTALNLWLLWKVGNLLSRFPSLRWAPYFRHKYEKRIFFRKNAIKSLDQAF